MLASEREELILDQATRYFAEFGLSAGTIELARRIGITQPLLYKYFPTKEALLVRIYDRLFPQNWSPALEALLEDETRPVRERLTQFYQQFTRTVLTYDHVRLFLFSGLTNSALNARYYTILTDRIFTRIIAALRTEYVEAPEGPPSEDEMELVQSLHACIYHVAFRRWLHDLTVEGDLDALIARKIDFYLDGAAASLKALDAAKPRPGSAGKAAATSGAKSRATAGAAKGAVSPRKGAAKPATRASKTSNRS
ncbi:TetR/AcrR family transcriptional regulator [Ancylobacter sp. MQZ15Z-1]|uniref:TetR/AcrR family transcriptional regulator n=1 Tax=Ancylobacter mangrovi TaxID=2972472 RepID=A0A9X2T615_9HYPH|nr:TetR/AcrR family transcriptional regulator [Ancylobacter mangrovi]MCS0494468.1 TetR/AcrR family transcriptional regulator [Ancylobacter mangrovi]